MTVCSECRVMNATSDCVITCISIRERTKNTLLHELLEVKASVFSAANGYEL